MSVTLRRVILCVLGVLAGLAAWPVVELALFHQSGFPSYLAFSMALGAVVGLVFGGAFGASEGIFAAIRIRALRGALTGAVVGVAGGIVGFLVGQAALFLLGNLAFRSYQSLTRVALPVARAIGWAVLGVFIGMSEGVRALSPKKAGIGALGGLAGGLVGGFLLEYARVLFPRLPYVRLAGLLLFGALIGLFYGLVERRLAFGVLRVLNGSLKGREFLITVSRMRIGASRRADLALPGYEGVAAVHALLLTHREEVILRRAAKEHPLYVNEAPVQEQRLKFEDVLKVGAAKLFYKVQ